MGFSQNHYRIFHRETEHQESGLTQFIYNVKIFYGYVKTSREAFQCTAVMFVREGAAFFRWCAATKTHFPECLYTLELWSFRLDEFNKEWQEGSVLEQQQAAVFFHFPHKKKKKSS